MFQINFNTFDHNFCESTIYSTGPHPEYFNAISSLFITFIGLNGLFKPKLSILLKMVYSSLTVNGIASCLYHYYNSIGFGILDRMSMILIAYTSMYLLIEPICSGYKKFLNIFLALYFTLILTYTGLHNELAFNILFAGFLLSLIFFINLINAPNHIILIGKSGVKYILFSCIFWLSTEALCFKIGFIKYLFGHVFWHIFVSYGGYLISLVPHYLYLDKKYNNQVIIKNDIFGLVYLDIITIEENVELV
jgi:hypothetical protein